MFLPCNPLGPDPSELAALYEQRVTLECNFLEAIDDNRPVPILSRMWTRIAHLDAELRRN
jgi:hypothetical protein